MRIAYVVGSYPSRSETFIAREIEALETRGATVEVFALWRDPASPPATRPVRRCSRWAIGQRSRHIGAIFKWQLYFLKALAREWRPALRFLWDQNIAFQMAGRFDALGVERVHAHFGNQPSTIAWVAASVAGVPFSFSVHARDVFVEAQFFAGKARAADRIIACNSAAAARAAELAEPADRGKIALVPHGLPLDRYPLRSGVPAGDPLILGVGRLVEKKGFVHLVRAVAQLRARGLPIRCWLVGDGPERAALAAEVERLGLRGVVELKGWLPEAQVAAAYADAAALAVPSVVARDGDMDGLPNVVLEAAAIGVPIVATAVGGIGDLVRDGETGLVAREGDAGDLAAKLEAVLTDPAAALDRSSRARVEVAARFDQATTIPQLLEALGA